VIRNLAEPATATTPEPPSPEKKAAEPNPLAVVETMHRATPYYPLNAQRLDLSFD
jgi:hypothetical protein